MVNNYPEYAAGVNFKKTDSNGVRHFYSAQVVADPSDETIESKLIKDGVVISEGGPSVEALNVTENGTYSEEGKAYSPVVVNVAGGSSDFSTAEVTFICSNPTMADSFVNFNSTFYGNYENHEEGEIKNPKDGGFTETATPETFFSGSETVKNIILYKGNALLSIGDLVDEIDSISGNIVLFGRGQYKITGNCTIYYTPIGEAQ